MTHSHSPAVSLLHHVHTFAPFAHLSHNTHALTHTLAPIWPVCSEVCPPRAHVLLVLTVVSTAGLQRCERTHTHVPSRSVCCWPPIGHYCLLHATTTTPPPPPQTVHVSIFKQTLNSGWRKEVVDRADRGLYPFHSRAAQRPSRLQTSNLAGRPSHKTWAHFSE